MEVFNYIYKMTDSAEIIHLHDELYKEDYTVWSPFYPEAERDLRFFLGDQWSDDEKKFLDKQNRHRFVFNKIRRNILMITGYQRKHRLSSVVVPVEGSDQATADLRSELLLQIFSAGNAYNNFSEGNAGSAKTGFNLSTVWMDYRDDPINGDVKFGREPYSGFITDPYFTKLDFSDCSHVMRRKYINVELAVSLLPKHREEVLSLHASGWNRDDKFTWLPYQQYPDGGSLLAFDEFYQQKWSSKPFIVNMKTGEFFKWEGNESDLPKIKRLYPQLTVIKKPTRHIEKHVIVNNQHILSEINPYGLDEYPFAPVVAIFEPESPDWSLKTQSLVRPQIDPQREKNIRISQMTDIQDSQINSGWIVTSDSVVNPTDLFQSGQGNVIWRKSKTSPEDLQKIPPAQVPQSSFQMHELFDKEMMDVLGLNEAAYGIPASGGESGYMMSLRQQAALSNLQDVVDHWSYAQKMISYKVLKLIQQWTPEKIKRLTGKEPTADFYDPDSTKYDIRVQEGLLSETQAQIHFAQLTELQKMTGGENSPITTSDLLEAAPMQGKSELTKKIQQREQAASEQAQQQAQKQEEIKKIEIEIQKDLAESKIVANIGTGVERVTRGFSNVGLRNERASQAVENRASATLDRAKAITELKALDDDRLIKWVNIIKSMEFVSEEGEQAIKTEDAAEIEGVTSKLAPQQQQQQQQQQEQQQEQQPLGEGN